ncbi:MAG: hypothetical protein ACI9HY_003595, partial [Planctomycetaceae bacterium]
AVIVLAVANAMATTISFLRNIKPLTFNRVRASI